MLERDELQTFVEMGQAFWTDLDYSRRKTTEALTTVALAYLTDERQVERAAAALLEQAEREGGARNAARNSSHLSEPFYRLSVEQRFVLIALHVGNWSYARLGRILGLSVEGVQELAWSTRVSLASAVKPNSAFYGGPAQSELISCPDYDSKRPWTQRFFDEEIGVSRERLFLQNHAMVCDGCRGLIQRARDLYYTVEATLPRAKNGIEITEYLASTLQQVDQFKDPSRLTVKRSLVRFLSRPDAQVLIILAVLGFLVALSFR
jgi:hypothetical protein